MTDFAETLKKAAGADDSPVATKKFRASPAPAFGYADINRLEHCTRLLQKNIRQIIEDAPSVKTLHELIQDPTLSEFSRQELQGNPLLQLLAKLKTLYESGELPIFDEIVDNRLEVAPRKVADKSAIEVEVNDEDGNHNQGNAYQDIQHSRTHKQDTKEQHSVTDLSSQPHAHNEAETTGTGKGGHYRKESQKDSQELPPLPPIRDPALRNRVFQHKSTSANKTYLDEQEIVLAHNERLEFLGDAVLNTLVTLILYERLPYASEGVLSQTRAQLVNNRTLAEFSAAYGFDQALRCTVDDSALRSSQKMYADVFEAYLGALAVERHLDLAPVEGWLSRLMHARIETAAAELLRLVPINKDAKTELYSLVGSAAFHPTYKVVVNGDGVNLPYKVHCIMGDDVLGEGAAPGLKDAGLRAAMAALKNRPMLEKYGRQRWETDRCVSVVSAKNDVGDHNDTHKADFPIVADKSVLANKFAKNELYAYFGKQLGLTPEYTTTADPENRRYRVELRVNDTVVAVAFDASKKNAMSRAAAVVLENKHRMNEILNYIG